MENIQPVIKFYEKRTFGEKMSAAFEFLKVNLKLILKLSIYLLLPLAFIQGIFMNAYVGGIANMNQFTTSGSNSVSDISNYFAPILGNMILLLLVGIIANSLMITITFTTLQKYNEEGTLKGMTFTDLKEGIIRNGKRALGMSLIVMLLVIGYYLVAGMFIALSPLTLLITIPGLIAIAIPMTMLFPIYIFENVSAGTAVGKAFKLGFKTWGGLFGILLISGILAGILQGVGSIPWYIIFMVKTVLTATNQATETVNTFGYSIAQYLTAVIMLFFSYVSSILVYSCLAYHYASASEATEATSVNEDLANFEQLKDE